MPPAAESESADATIVAGAPAAYSFASGRCGVRRRLPEGHCLTPQVQQKGRP